MHNTYQLGDPLNKHSSAPSLSSAMAEEPKLNILN